MSSWGNELVSVPGEGERGEPRAKEMVGVWRKRDGCDSPI